MSDIENGYCALNAHGLYGGKDRDCPWCRIAELEAALKKYVPKLTETIRMPNTEWVSDEHNEAVRALRALIGNEDD
jgi:hypothetical protein